MSSSGAGAKQWTVKFDISEKEIMQNVITHLLEILCSYFEHITQDNLNALRSAQANYIDHEVNMDAFLAEVSVVREDCKERMDRMKQAESALMKAIEDIRNELDHWPVSAKGSVSLACDEEQRLLSNISDQRHRIHSKDEEDDAYTRISLFLEHERKVLTKYFTCVKDDPEPNRLKYATFATDPAILDSIGANRPLHMHDAEDIKRLADKPRSFDSFGPGDCEKYLCPFHHQFHYHECKLSDCRPFHLYPCYNIECGQLHGHPIVGNDDVLVGIRESCDGNECDKYQNMLKFGDSICVQRKPSEAHK